MRTLKNSWRIMWNIGPYTVNGYDGFGPHLPVCEDDLILARCPGANMIDLDIPYLKMYVCQYPDGAWVWKRYELQYDFCFRHSCDRVQFKENLQEDLEDIMLCENDLHANAKR